MGKKRQIMPVGHSVKPATVAPEIVTFRMWKVDGKRELIALFPQQEQQRRGLVGSFMHIGQHGDADLWFIMQNSKPATPAEYADLKKELETHYDYKLNVRKRISYKNLWWANK